MTKEKALAPLGGISNGRSPSTVGPMYQGDQVLQIVFISGFSRVIQIALKPAAYRSKRKHDAPALGNGGNHSPTLCKSADPKLLGNNSLNVIRCGLPASIDV